MIDAEELLGEARERLTWLREEYGEGDIDYLTFGPIVALLDQLLSHQGDTLVASPRQQGDPE